MTPQYVVSYPRINVIMTTQGSTACIVNIFITLLICHYFELKKSNQIKGFKPRKKKKLKDIHTHKKEKEKENIKEHNCLYQRPTRVMEMEQCAR